MKATSILKILTFGLMILLVSCSEDRNETKNSYGSVSFSISTEDNLKSADILKTGKEPCFVYISVRNLAGDYIYNLEKLPLIKLGGGYITKNIEFAEDSYQIEDFLVVDSYDSVIYITPKAGSEFEELVEHPLPIEFHVTPNNITSVILEVIPSDLGEPIEYGYATFSFNIVNTLDMGVAAYYPLDSNANDFSDNNNHGLVKGPIQVRDRMGNLNGAYEFDGVNDVIIFGDILDNVIAGEDKEFAFSFWIKPNFSGNYNYSIFAKNADSNCNEEQRQFSIQKSPDNKIDFVWHSYLTHTGYRGVKSNTALTDTTKWYHVAINYHGSVDSNNGLDRVDIYIDGMKEDKTMSYNRGSLGYIQDGSAHFAMGGTVTSDGESCGNRKFKGSLDEVRIYNRTLYEKEIFQLSKK